MKNRIITEKLIADFETELRNDEKSNNTIEKYMRDVWCFAEFVGGRIVDKALVLEYKVKLEGECALTNANSMIAAINSFLKFVGWIDLCVKQFKVQRKTYSSEESELTKQEYIALVRAAGHKENERLSLLIQTICGTGIRVSVLEFITVGAIKRGEAMVSFKGKSRKVFIVSGLCKKLLRYAKECGITAGSIFITKSSKPMNRSNIWREMKALCVQADVNPNKVFPHNLRHLFARTFYGIEKDIAKLADILGYTSINIRPAFISFPAVQNTAAISKICAL